MKPSCMSSLTAPPHYRDWPPDPTIPTSRSPGANRKKVSRTTRAYPMQPTVTRSKMKVKKCLECLQATVVTRSNQISPDLLRPFRIIPYPVTVTLSG